MGADSLPAASSWQLWPTQTGPGCGQGGSREWGKRERSDIRRGQTLANDPAPKHAETPGRQDPRCHTTRATLPHPTSRACSRGRHQIPLRHALLPRSKSRGRQQREEQDRGSNYPAEGSTRLPTSSSDSSLCTRRTQNDLLSPQPAPDWLAPTLGDPLTWHHRQLLGVT